MKNAFYEGINGVGGLKNLELSLNLGFGKKDNGNSNSKNQRNHRNTPNPNDPNSFSNFLRKEEEKYQLEQELKNKELLKNDNTNTSNANTPNKDDNDLKSKIEFLRNLIKNINDTSKNK